jgi:hypothetical protein
MYCVAEIIENDGAFSMINEVSFHPSGAFFAATYENLNEIRIYDSRTRKLLQVFQNPESQIDHPHGVLATQKYLLVANTHNRTKPGTINVYRNDWTTTNPIQMFQSPFGHLHEPHSMAMQGGRLVMTYCENLAPSGAVVSYEFNEETGRIEGPIDKTETWFGEYGDSKGICFNADGTKIFVTFESDKNRTTLGKLNKFRKKVIKNLFFKKSSGDNTVKLDTHNAQNVITKPTKN